MDLVTKTVRLQSIVVILWMSSGLSVQAVAQISPGDLSEAHASLEGITQCTSCHQIGKAVVGSKCLDCHAEVKARITAGTGYHGRLQNAHCVDCHKEHHGRSFDLIRFDEKGFNHAAVGFTLEGKHAAAKCQSCHSERYVKADDIRRNEKLMKAGTFLGLGSACLSCHEDRHKGQLSKECQGCHAPQAWKPASRFNHGATAYPLTGRHRAVSCERCHLKPGPDISAVKFRGLDHSSCLSCHGDPHKKKFSQSCESCHSTDGWQVGASRHFNHASTRFPLRGKHATVSCEGCHHTAKEKESGRSIQQFAVMRFQKCSDCHADVHRGEFARLSGAGECESCHTEKGFAPSLFSHEKSRFPLVGQHRTVPCEKCHSRTTDARRPGPVNFRVTEFSRCSNCHLDSHGGQFVRRSDGGACESCHTVKGYVPSLYSLDDHAKAEFTLTGSHQAVSCAACHRMATIKGTRQRQFAWEGRVRCSSCHKDVHSRQFQVESYGGCESCHVSTEWKWIRFDHDRTKFPLTDKHAKTPCAGCHETQDRTGKTLEVRYAGTPRQCVGCHRNSDVRSSGSS